MRILVIHPPHGFAALCCTRRRESSWGRHLFVLAALVAVTVGVVLKVRSDRHADPPFGPEKLRAVATLRTIGYDVAQALIPNAPHPNRDGWLIHGQVTWQKPPAEAGGVFEILVIDKRKHHKPNVVVQQGPSGTYTNGLCCAPHYDVDKIEQKYPWLAGAADPRDGDKILSNMDTLCVLPQAGGVSFVALLLPAKRHDGKPEMHWATAPAEPSDFLVALVYIGEDRQIHWAQKLYG